MHKRIKKTLRTAMFWWFFLIFLILPLTLILVYRADIKGNNIRQYAGYQEHLLMKVRYRILAEMQHIHFFIDSAASMPFARGGAIRFFLNKYFNKNSIISGYAFLKNNRVTASKFRPGKNEFIPLIEKTAASPKKTDLHLQTLTRNERDFQLLLLKKIGNDQTISVLFDLDNFMITYIAPLIQINGTRIRIIRNDGVQLTSSLEDDPRGVNMATLGLPDKGSQATNLLNYMRQTRHQTRHLRYRDKKDPRAKEGVFSWELVTLGNTSFYILITTPEEQIIKEFFKPDLTILLLLLSLSLITGYLGIIYYRTRKRADTAAMRASTIPGLEQNIMELDQARSRYSTLFNALMDGIIIFDDEGKIIECNQAFADMLGYTPGELHDSSRRSITPPKYWRFEDDEIHTQLINWGFTKDYEKEFIRKDGSLIPVIINSTLVKEQGEESPITLSTLRDISAQKRADREIEKLHKHLQNIIESSPSAIITLDGSFIITSFNSSAEEFFRIDRSRIINRNLMESIPFFRKYGSWLEKTISSKKTFTLTSEKYEVDGYEKKYTNITFYPLLFEEEGSITIHLEEITEQVELEHQLFHSQKLEALGTLASGFAHDFNNLLAGLFSYISVLKMQVEEPATRKTVDIIDDISKKATTLVRQILTFSRSSNIHAQPVSLHAITMDVLSILSHSIPEGITIHNNIKEEEPLVLGDSSQLSQVLLNLIINARDAMPDGGELTMDFQPALKLGEIPDGISKQEQMARMSIQDTGIGIPATIQPKIFDPFFTTKSKGKGTGLGLSTVYGILRNHKGGIEVTSQPGQGTRVDIFLPLAGENTTNDTRSENEDSGGYDTVAKTRVAGSKQAQPAVKKRSTILIIDDEEVICNALRDGLTRLGYSVLTAESGEMGLELYKKHTPDLIILDMIMQGLSGEETFDLLKQENPLIRVIIHTGFTHPETQLRMKRKGALEVVHKPYEIMEMGRLVQNHLGD